MAYKLVVEIYKLIIIWFIFLIYSCSISFVYNYYISKDKINVTKWYEMWSWIHSKIFNLNKYYVINYVFWFLYNITLQIKPSCFFKICFLDMNQLNLILKVQH